MSRESTPGEVLAVVPARGGSKSIHRKNLRELGGHPLLAWAIAAARGADTISRTILTTDDPEMREVGLDYGAEAPFLRPAELARDDTPDLPVFLHLLDWLEREEGYRPEIVVQLRPTSPFRSPDMVDRAVALLRDDTSGDSVRTVIPSGQNPYKMWRIEEGYLSPLLSHPHPEPFNLPRQALPSTYWQTGHVDAVRNRTVVEGSSMTGRRILPLVVDPQYAVDIDNEDQLSWAQWILRQGRLALARPEKSAGLSGVQMVVFDFDGVMTDNRVYVTEDGRESVACSRSDGMGLAALKSAGFRLAVLSTETNGVVQARCKKLGIDCRQGLDDKGAAFEALVAEAGLPMESVVFVGNDGNDVDCMRRAGMAVAVADAHPTAVEEAHRVLSKKGGRGAVRELCDLLLELRAK